MKRKKMLVHEKARLYFRRHRLSGLYVATQAGISAQELNQHISRGLHLYPEDEARLLAALKRLNKSFRRSDIYE